MGMDSRVPTDGEIGEMADLVAEALEQGAVGFSTGLEYSPQRHADTDEVRVLAAELEPYGRPFVAHIRSYRETMWEALDEFVDVGADTGVPVHLSHFKLGGPKAGLPDRALALARAARERGVDFTADLYPYAPGSTMLLAMLPAWVHAEGVENIPDVLSDEGSRAVIRRDIDAASDSWSFDWDSLVISGLRSGDDDLLGRSVAEAASARDQHPVDFACELLLDEDLEVTMVAMRTSDHAEADIREIMAADLVAVGSDGIFGDRPHPRVYGTYPRMFGRLAREENLLTLEEAIRKATSLPARISGLQRKGLVREGMDADLVVLDPASVHSPATFEDPTRPARGIEHVVVGGTFVVRDGTITGKTPGEAIRA
jgi:N-acyl-D-amino-acid deacylase